MNFDFPFKTQHRSVSLEVLVHGGGPEINSWLAKVCCW